MSTKRVLITTVAVALAVAVPAGAAQARKPVTRAAASNVTHRLAEQAASGIEELSHGAASIDRSRTSVGNYLRYGKFRMGASFAVFGTITVDGVARELWCVGYVELVMPKIGGIRVDPGTVSCPTG